MNICTPHEKRDEGMRHSRVWGDLDEVRDQPLLRYELWKSELQTPRVQLTNSLGPVAAAMG